MSSELPSGLKMALISGLMGAAASGDSDGGGSLDIRNILGGASSSSNENELSEQAYIDMLGKFEYTGADTDHGFKVGDLVTYKAGTTRKWQGKPMMVVEIFDTPVRNTSNAGTPEHCTLFHGRIAIPFPDGKVNVFADNFITDIVPFVRAEATEAKTAKA